MTPDLALALSERMLWTALITGAPVIGVSMLVGLIVSVFQVVTQIQEMTLTFVPKLIAIFFVFLMAGSWMLGTILQFATAMVGGIPGFVR